MGLPWVRLDTQFPSNPKVLRLAEDKRWRAAFCYVAGLAYCGQHGTDGYIPGAALPFIHATRADAKALVDVELWREDVGGYLVNDWDEFQLSDEDARKRKEKARRAALKRWRGTEFTA